MKELPKATTDGFKRIFHGEVVFPGDVNYDEVRQIWNAMIDRKPALIARCKSAEDVVQAVHFGQQVVDRHPELATQPAKPATNRLAALKKKYDPTNFFRMNQNIRPA